MVMAVSFSNGPHPDLDPSQYPPPLLPKPGKDNARLQKLIKKSSKKKSSSCSQTPIPFRLNLSPVNEISDLEFSDTSTPPRTPDVPLYGSSLNLNCYSGRPFYQQSPTHLSCRRNSPFHGPEAASTQSLSNLAPVPERHIAPLYACSSFLFDDATPITELSITEPTAKAPEPAAGQTITPGPYGPRPAGVCPAPPILQQQIQAPVTSSLIATAPTQAYTAPPQPPPQIQGPTPSALPQPFTQGPYGSTEATPFPKAPPGQSSGSLQRHLSTSTLTLGPILTPPVSSAFNQTSIPGSYGHKTSIPLSNLPPGQQQAPMPPSAPQPIQTFGGAQFPSIANQQLSAGPYGHTVTTQAPGFPNQPTQGPYGPTVTTQVPSFPNQPTQGSYGPTLTTQVPIFPNQPTQGPYGPTVTTQVPSFPNQPIQGPYGPTVGMSPPRPSQEQTLPVPFQSSPAPLGPPQIPVFSQTSSQPHVPVLASASVTHHKPESEMYSQGSAPNMVSGELSAMKKHLKVYTSKATFYELSKPPSLQDITGLNTSYNGASLSTIHREKTPTFEAKNSVTSSYDPTGRKTPSGRPKTPAFHVSRAKTPVLEISKANPLLFAAPPTFSSTKDVHHAVKKEVQGPISSIITRSEASAIPLNTLKPSVPQEINKPQIQIQNGIDLNEPQKEVSLAAKVIAEALSIPKLPSDVFLMRTKPIEASQLTSTASVETVPTMATQEYQIPRAQTYEAVAPTTPSKEFTIPRSVSQGLPVPAPPPQSYQNPITPYQTPVTPVHWSPRPPSRLLGNQRLNASTSELHKPRVKSTYYGLTPVEYAAYGGIKTYYGPSANKTQSGDAPKSCLDDLSSSRTVNSATHNINSSDAMNKPEEKSQQFEGVTKLQSDTQTGTKLSTSMIHLSVSQNSSGVTTSSDNTVNQLQTPVSDEKIPDTSVLARQTQESPTEGMSKPNAPVSSQQKDISPGRQAILASSKELIEQTTESVMANGCTVREDLKPSSVKDSITRTTSDLTNGQSMPIYPLPKTNINNESSHAAEKPVKQMAQSLPIQESTSTQQVIVSKQSNSNSTSQPLPNNSTLSKAQSDISTETKKLKNTTDTNLHAATTKSSVETTVSTSITGTEISTIETNTKTTSSTIHSEPPKTLPEVIPSAINLATDFNSLIIPSSDSQSSKKLTGSIHSPYLSKDETGLPSMVKTGTETPSLVTKADTLTKSMTYARALTNPFNDLTTAVKQSANSTTNTGTTPTMLRRTSSTPTIERRPTSTPTVDKRTTPNPTIDRRITSTPIMDRRVSSTPTMDRRTTSTPIMGRITTSTPTIDRRTTSTPTIDRRTTSTPTMDRRTISTPIVDRRTSSTPTMERRTSSTPTMDRRILSTPTMDRRTLLTPIMDRRTSSTPTMDRRTPLTPIMDRRISTTPIMDRRNLTTPTMSTTPTMERKSYTALSTENKLYAKSTMDIRQSIKSDSEIRSSGMLFAENKLSAKSTMDIRASVMTADTEQVMNTKQYLSPRLEHKSILSTGSSTNSSGNGNVSHSLENKPNQTTDDNATSTSMSDVKVTDIVEKNFDPSTKFSLKLTKDNKPFVQTSTNLMPPHKIKNVPSNSTITSSDSKATMDSKVLTEVSSDSKHPTSITQISTIEQASVSTPQSHAPIKTIQTEAPDSRKTPLPATDRQTPAFKTAQSQPTLPENQTKSPVTIQPQVLTTVITKPPGSTVETQATVTTNTQPQSLPRAQSEVTATTPITQTEASTETTETQPPVSVPETQPIVKVSPADCGDTTKDKVLTATTNHKQSASSTTPPSTQKKVDEVSKAAPKADTKAKASLKPKGLKAKLSGWNRLKKHMVVEPEEPQFPELDSKTKEPEDDKKKGGEGKAGSTAGDKPTGQEIAKEEAPPRAMKMWDAVLFQMFSTKDKILKQMNGKKTEEGDKKPSKESQVDIPSFVYHLPVLLYSPRFDARKLREAAEKPLNKIATMFERGLIQRKTQEEEPKDFNRTARGFGSSKSKTTSNGPESDV
ncbi:mucin-2 [Sardina pilchardus]|uniref:mucin-2 n=1 Tax=Sardina pilchardus TaxID=27697 RepID=UPI002E14C0BF